MTNASYVIWGFLPILLYRNDILEPTLSAIGSLTLLKRLKGPEKRLIRIKKLFDFDFEWYKIGKFYFSSNYLFQNQSKNSADET